MSLREVLLEAVRREQVHTIPETAGHYATAWLAILARERRCSTLSRLQKTPEKQVRMPSLELCTTSSTVSNKQIVGLEEPQ